MKKTTKLLATTLIAASLLAFGGTLASCGGTSGKDSASTPGGSASSDSGSTQTPPATETNKFEDYTKAQYLAENFAGKEIAYQFTNPEDWTLEEYSMYFNFCVNCYEDGSLRIEQRHTHSGASYYYYGYWGEEETEDGNQVNVSTVYMTDLSGGLINHIKDYEVLQQNDGNYQFTFDFCMAPGQYTRQHPVTAGSTVAYTTEEAYHTAVDVVEAVATYTSEVVNDFQGNIVLYSNGTVEAKAIYTKSDGWAPYQKTGTYVKNLNEDNTAYVSTTITIEGEEPIVVANDQTSFTWNVTVNVGGQSAPFTFTMTLVTEEAAA